MPAPELLPSAGAFRDALAGASLATCSRFRSSPMQVFRLASRAALAASAFALCLPLRASAHHPHDGTTAFALTARLAGERELFLSSFGSFKLFLYSDDSGGTFEERRAGLQSTYVQDVALSPAFADDRTAFALTWRGSAGDEYNGGLHRSTDAGLSWESPPRPLTGVAIAISPAFETDQTLFYASATSLYRSTDGGLSDEELGNVSPDQILDVEISPGFEHDRSLALVLERMGLALSEDGGDTWTLLPDALFGGFGPGFVTSVAFSPKFRVDDTMWVTTHGLGVWVSRDRGTIWRSANNGLTGILVNDIAVSPGYPGDPFLYCTTARSGCFVSTDGGATWEPTSLEVEFSTQTDNHYRRVELPDDFVSDRSVYVGTYEGLFRSDDAGQTWRQSHINPTRMGRTAGYIPPDGIGNHHIIASGYGQAALYSDDAGATWELRGTGLDSESVYSVAASPFYWDFPILFCGSGNGLRRSTDHGVSWQRIDLPAINPWVLEHVVRAFAFAPDFESSRTMWALTGGGLYESTNAGRHWSGMATPVAIPQAGLVISPDFAADSTFFVAGRDQRPGVHRSTDGGRSWNPCGDAANVSAMDLAISPHFGPGDQRVYFVNRAGTIAFSTDAGDTWQNTAATLAADPTALEAVAGPAGGVLLIVATSGDGVFMSSDDGVTWQQIGTPEQGVGSGHRLAASADFGTSGQALLGNHQGFWRTTDGGVGWELTTTWERYDDKRAEPIIFDSDPLKTVRKALAGSFNVTETFIWQASDQVILDFDGVGVRWLGSKGPGGGIAKINLDGVLIETVDGYAATHEQQTELFEITGLERGLHTLLIRATGTKNPLSTNTLIGVDAIDVIIED